MDVKELAAKAVTEAWHEEIERAIDNVKRTKWDTWMRKEWHKATARERWSEWGGGLLHGRPDHFAGQLRLAL